MTKNGPASVNAGDTITWTIDVLNHGPSAAVNAVLRDTLPAGATFLNATGAPALSGRELLWGPAPLANGGSASFTVKALAPAAGGSISNVARISAATNDPNAANNRSVSTTTVVPVANVGVSKSGPAQANPGAVIAYVLTTSNAGPSTAGAVQLTDALPGNVTFVSATNGGVASSGVVTWPAVSLAAGQVRVDTVRVTVGTTAGLMTNVASVSTSTKDPVSANDTSQVVTSVTVANLRVSARGPASGLAGSTVTDTIVVFNAGPSAVSARTVTATLPAGVTVTGFAPSPTNVAGNTLTWNVAGTLAPSDSTTFIVQWSGPAAAGAVDLTATVSSTTFDPDLSDNQAVLSTTVNPAADLQLSMTAQPATINAQDNITYTITVNNLGPSDATAVQVTDNLPSNMVAFVSATGGVTPSGNVLTFNPIASIASGGSVQLDVTITGPAAGSVSNTASVASAVGDPVPANNSTTLILPIAAADLVVSVTGPVNAAPGDIINFIVTLSNQGPSGAVGVTLRNTLPTNATFVDVSPAASGGTPAAPEWSIARLDAGHDTVFTVRVIAPLIGDVVNTAAVVSSSSTDPNGATGSFTTHVNPLAADLSVDIAPSQTTVNVGDTITYTITVTNNSGNPSAVITLTNTVTSAAIVPGSSGGGTEAAGSVSWSFLAIAGGASEVRTVKFVATTSAVDVIATAVVGAASPDPDLTNNTQTATTKVN